MPIVIIFLLKKNLGIKNILYEFHIFKIFLFDAILHLFTEDVCYG